MKEGALNCVTLEVSIFSSLQVNYDCTNFIMFLITASIGCIRDFIIQVKKCNF